MLGDGPGLIGREKLTDLWLASLSSSSLVGNGCGPVVLPVPAGLVVPSTLVFLPPRLGGGDVMRIVGCKLDERLLEAATDAGRAGTGGASGAGATGAAAAAARPGDGERKVRSVMDALLSRLTMPRPVPGLAMMLALPTEDCELRRAMRLVWMLPTGSGEVVWERKAAAAAAEESEVVEIELCRKALLAAMAAEALGGALILGCWLVNICHFEGGRRVRNIPAAKWRAAARRRTALWMCSLKDGPKWLARGGSGRGRGRDGGWGVDQWVNDKVIGVTRVERMLARKHEVGGVWNWGERWAQADAPARSTRRRRGGRVVKGQRTRKRG